MNHETKTRWLAALESGEYQQCSGTLSNGSGYCCLGVLAKIEGATFTPNPDDTECAAYIGERRVDEGYIMLTDDFAAQHGLTDNGMCLLAALNDGKCFHAALDNPLYELARSLSLEATMSAVPSAVAVRFHFWRHSFREIAAIIRANF